jgi:hypothetical protein
MLDVNLLKKSVNYRLLASGLAYPMYYNGLFSDLRAAFTQSMIVARSEGRGLWPYDGTTTGFSVSDLQTLTDEVVVLPKLFRRIIEYIGNGGKIDDFKEHLLKGCDPLVRLPAVDFTRLDAVVDVQGDLVRLTELPENLVFLDKVLCKKS